jgi:hypothetical protein
MNWRWLMCGRMSLMVIGTMHLAGVQEKAIMLLQHPAEEEPSL